MSHTKPLLIPWLRAQIDSGRFPGVCWTNPEQTEFCIPWKHALRHDSSDADVLIFKAWAEVSGHGHAQAEPSICKRNFRSALRAKGFKMLSDNKNDPANPHKVFRWPEGSAARAKSSAGSTDQDDPGLFQDCSFSVQETGVVPCLLQGQSLLSETTKQDLLQECLEGLNIGPETEDTVSPEQQQLQYHAAIGGHTFPGQQQYPVAFEGETGLPEQPTQPIEGAEGGACGEQLVMQFLDTINKTRDGDHFKTQFRIAVFYRGVKVSEQLVENEAGARLVYRPELPGPVLDPGSGLSLVSLPSPGAMLDGTQANLTQRILDKLGDGLDVGVSGHVVYSQRWGEIKAFWSLSKFDRSPQPQEISKLQPQPLYHFRDFVRGILDFMDGRECYPCSLFFCLGEKWPDPDRRPWEKKLITVEVTLTSMELLKNMAVGGGASSLRSEELQISLEEMMDTC